MDIVLKSRHLELTDRFRDLVEEKLARLEKHDHRVIRVEVEVDKERNPRLQDRAIRVQLTAFSKGPVIRAESSAEDKVAALDQAVDKMASQMRRAADRRRVHLGRHTPKSVAEALAGLSARGVRMGICTNKRLAPAQHILAGLGLGGYFEAVIARESCPQRKPHPAPLHATLRALGVSPADSVMVGDSLVDVECARAAGIPVVAVAHGYSEVPVQELAADVIIESCAALMEALEAMAR